MCVGKRAEEIEKCVLGQMPQFEGLTLSRRIGILGSDLFYVFQKRRSASAGTDAESGGAAMQKL